MKKGLLIILSGPSGVGKGTVRKRLIECHPELGLNYSVSMTTRSPRNQEINGVDYFFVTQEQFDQNIANDNFLEYSSFVGNRYGTPKDYVYNLLDQGKNVLLEIEVNGAKQVINKLDRNERNFVSIFLTASIESLRDRIRNRKTESEEVINERLAKALKEFDEIGIYDFVVVNEEIDETTNKIYDIINKNLK